VHRVLAALLLLTTVAGAAPLPFIEDDYPRALKQARRARRPIFVESWAPW
jgi:hypothetical protein